MGKASGKVSAKKWKRKFMLAETKLRKMLEYSLAALTELGCWSVINCRRQGEVDGGQQIKSRPKVHGQFI